MLGGYWLSGDLVYRDANDDYFHVDRAVDQIPDPYGTGYSQLMEEILLLQLEEVADCAVVAGIDGDHAMPVAIVRTKQAGSNAQELLDRANEALGNAGQPPLAMLEIAQQDPTSHSAQLARRSSGNYASGTPTCRPTWLTGLLSARLPPTWSRHSSCATQ